MLPKALPGIVEPAVSDEAPFEAERARLTLNSIGDAVMSLPAEEFSPLLGCHALRPRDRSGVRNANAFRLAQREPGGGLRSATWFAVPGNFQWCNPRRSYPRPRASVRLPWRCAKVSPP